MSFLSILEQTVAFTGKSLCQRITISLAADQAAFSLRRIPAGMATSTTPSVTRTSYE